METQVYSRKDYSLQVQVLAKKLQAIESKLEEIAKWSSQSSSNPGAFQETSTEPFDYTLRIPLLGARALTEFKVRELYSALDRLTDEGRDSQAALHLAVQRADDLSQEVLKIRAILVPTASKQQLINTGDIVQATAVGPRIERSAIGGTRGSSKKEGPTTFSMAASANATQVNGASQSRLQKTGSNTKGEISVDDVRKRMDEVVKQAKSLQQLVSDLVDKAESIKKQEETTDSKLSDMRLLRKNWEIKKVPVNSEIDTVENKLTSEVVKYQETLKEIDRLKQFLTTMFNGIFQQGPEDRK